MTTLTVTATQAGSPANGMALRVMVITGALPVASQTGGSAGTNFASGTSYTVSVTTTQTGSRVYGACSPFTGGVSSAAAANTTLIDNVLDATNSDNYVTFKGTSTTGTPGATSFGCTNTANAGAAGPSAYEVLVSTTLAEDGSGPAVASTTTATAVTTASFTPPAGSLLVALIAADGGTGAETMTVTDNLGVHLNWTEKARNTSGAGNDYNGVWIADVPGGTAAAAAAFPAQPGQAWLRRFHHPQQLLAGPVAGTIQATASLDGNGTLSASPVQTLQSSVTLSGLGTLAQGVQPVGNPSGGPWVLVFEDHFDNPVNGKPDPSVWADHLIDGDAMRCNDNPSEVEWYPHNMAGLSVASSILSLTARHEDPRTSTSVGYDPLAPNTLPSGNAPAFTSGMVQSRPGFAFSTPIYVEGRFQMPLQALDWPAFWGVSIDQTWPPEYDIFEELNGADQFTSTYHPVAGGSSSAANTGGGLSSWHVFGMRMTASGLDYFLDGVKWFTPTDWDGTALPWMIVINYAITTGSGGTYPATLQCDYVRAWTVQGTPAQPSITSISPSTGIPSAGSITVNFNTVSGATTYRATPSPKDALADGSPNTRLSVTGSSSPLTITGLTNGARYVVTVAANNATGWSIESLPTPPAQTSFLPSAALSGAGTLTASGSVSGGATASLSGLGTLTAAPQFAGSAALSGSGTLTAAPQLAGAANLSGTGTLTASPQLAGGASLSGLGTLSAAVTTGTTAALSGSGTLTASPQGAGGASLSGAGTLTASPQLAGAANLSGTGTLTASPQLAATAALSGAGTLTASPQLAGALSLSGSGTLTALWTLRETLAMSGAGTLSVSQSAGSANLSGSGTLTAAPLLQGTASLSGLGTLSAAWALRQLAALSGTGTLTAATGVVFPSSAVLAGSGTLTAVVVPPFTVGSLTAMTAPGGSGGVLTASDTRTGGPG